MVYFTILPFQRPRDRSSSKCRTIVHRFSFFVCVPYNIRPKSNSMIIYCNSLCRFDTGLWVAVSNTVARPLRLQSPGLLLGLRAWVGSPDFTWKTSRTYSPRGLWRGCVITLEWSWRRSGDGLMMMYPVMRSKVSWDQKSRWRTPSTLIPKVTGLPHSKRNEYFRL